MKQFLRKIRLFWKQMLLNLKRRRRISNYRRTSPRRKAASAIMVLAASPASIEKARELLKKGFKPLDAALYPSSF